MATERKRNSSPRSNAGWLSVITFSWILPFLIKGFKKSNLNNDDIPDIRPEDRAEVLGEILEDAWDKHIEHCKEHNKKPSFMKVLGNIFLAEFMMKVIFILILECMIGILQPMSLGLLLEYLRLRLDEKDPRIWKYYLGIGGIIGTSLFYAFTFRVLIFEAHHIGVQIRIACSKIIYKKVMRLSSNATESSDVGEILILLSRDLNQFDEMDIYYAYLLVAPIQVVLALGVLYFRYFGYPALVGVFLLVVYAPLQILVGHLFSVFREKIASFTYRRVRILAEAFNNIYVIKLYGWEPFFLGQTEKIREQELTNVYKATILRYINSTLSIFLPKCLIFITLYIYVHFFHGILTAENVFVTLCLYENITFVLTMFFPLGVKNIADFKVAIRHIQSFLQLEEKVTLECSLSERKPGELMKTHKAFSSPADLSVEMVNATFVYRNNHNGFQLKGINLQLKGPGVIMVIGNVGSGKSCLLNSICKQTLCPKGNIKSHGDVYFCPATPWIFPGTLRQNILTGLSYDGTWYESVLNACDLQDFANNFDAHDMAVLDSANLTLSIKARISLARTIYTDGDILVLDDPFYYIDVLSAIEILTTCMQSVLRNKMVIMVATKTQLLKYATNIIIMSKGQLLLSGGSYNDQSHGKLEIIEDDVDLLLEESKRRASLINIHEDVHPAANSNFTIIQHHDELLSHAKEDDQPQTIPLGSISDETVFSNSIGMKIYFQYLSYGNGCCILLCFILVFVLTQMSHSTMEFAIECFTQREEMVHHNMIMDNEKSHPFSRGSKDVHAQFATSQAYCHPFELLGTDRKSRLIVFLVIIFVMFFLAIIRVASFYRVCLRTSRRLQYRMVQCLMKASIKFFEINPMGRILNRCSQDTCAVDESLPPVLYEVFDTFLMFLGGMSLLLVLNAYMIITNVVLVVVFFLINGFEEKTISNLKRMEGSARSPVISTMTTTLQGLDTIHALRQEDLFLETFNRALDTHTKIWYTLLAAEHWLSFVFDVVSVLYIGVVTALFLVFHDENPSYVGLGILQAIVLNKYLQLFMLSKTTCDNLMVALERIMEYTKIPREAAWKSGYEIPCPKNWPSEGEIWIKDLCYSSEAFKGVALKNVTLHIRPGERVGIIGKMGSGKSALLNVILRINEHNSGSVIIDGVDISKLELSEYRKRISVIPSDPVIFLATLRDNYDPLHEYSDEEIWKVIKDTYLLNTVKEMPEGLDTMLTKDNYHFSLGQRQLICFGRALLKRPKVLICNINAESDDTVHQIILNQFSECTIIAPAQQQHNVIEFNHLVVLEDGIVTDYDTPDDVARRDEISERVVKDLRRLSVLNQAVMAFQTYRQEKYQL